MKNRRNLWIAAVVILAAVIGAVLLLPGREPAAPAAPQGPARPVPTHGTIPGGSGPVPTDPVQTEGPEQTRPTDPAPTEPEEQPTWTAPEETEPEQTEPVIGTARFPVELEDGRLRVESIFSFSGMNPDGQNRFGEEIAGIQVTNTSEEYLLEAEIAAVLADGRTLTFLLQDVPSGRTVMAFCLEHEPLPGPDSCDDLYGYAEFSDGADLAPELVQLQVSGTEITLKNVSGRDLTNLNVTCHGLLDTSLFGGASYHYTVASLSAGGSAKVHAVDCILGMAEVVRVEIGG